MRYSARLTALVALTSLVGCAPLPEDVDSQEQAAVVNPGPTPIPNPPPDPCVVDPADVTFTQSVLLSSSDFHSDYGASEPGGLNACDYRTMEVREVQGLTHVGGFSQVYFGPNTYPGLTQADCEASTFSGWVRIYHPGRNGAQGSWETIASDSRHGRWEDEFCRFDTGSDYLHYLSHGDLQDATRIRFGSRLRVRHGGVWSRHPVESHVHIHHD